MGTQIDDDLWVDRLYATVPERWTDGCGHAAGERNPAAQAGDALADVPAALRELHARGATLEVRREQLAAHFGEQAARRYEALELDEQAW
jgi:hypothetical protein